MTLKDSDNPQSTGKKENRGQALRDRGEYQTGAPAKGEVYIHYAGKNEENRQS